jgi:uncharacterized protein (TIGR04141 family)
VAPPISLTGFLLKVGVEPTEVLTAVAAENASHFVWTGAHLVTFESESQLQFSDSMLLTVLSRPSSAAAWEVLIEHLFAPPGFAPASTWSLGSLVSVPVHDPASGEARRWLCWTFGAASRSIRREAVEPRFGLITALNRIATEAGGLRQLEYRSFGAYRQRTGHTAGRDTPLDGFRIDPVIDLLSGVGGRAEEGRGGQVYGSRPIRLRTTVEAVEDFKSLAQETLDDFRQVAYREGGFSFVDDFVPVDDPTELTDLKQALAELVLAESDRVDAFMPDDLVPYEDPRAVHFVLLPGERVKSHSRVNLTTSNLASAIDDGGAEALDRDMRFLDATGDIVATATILQCVSADFSLEGDRYVVSDGEFYRVQPEFVAAIDKSVAGIPPAPLSFPPYLSGTEADWLSATASGRPDELVLIDGEFVHLEGETPFEPADLLHVTGALIHAKRRGRSSALSYAMVQARRSSQTLPAVEAARDQLAGLVRKHAQSVKTARVVLRSLERLAQTPPSLDVILIFLGPLPKRGLIGLPLLAKLELSETARQIGQFGFRLSVALVGAS